MVFELFFNCATVKPKNFWMDDSEMVHADVCNDAGSFTSAAKFPSSLGQVPLFKFRQCEDYPEQSKPYFI